MSRRKTIIIAITMLVIGLTAIGVCIIMAPSSETTIYEVYTRYDQALDDKNGAAASKLVSKDTIRYYQDALDNALNIRPPKFDTLSTFDRYMILRLRHSFSRSELETMDGKQVFIIGVERGWTGDNPRPDAEQIEKISIDEKTASISFKQYPGIPIIFLIREDNSWKLDLAFIIRGTDKMFEDDLKKHNKTITNEQIIEILKDNISESETVDPAILDGPIDR